MPPGGVRDGGGSLAGAVRGGLHWRFAMSHSTRCAGVLCSFFISHGHGYEGSVPNARGATPEGAR